MTRMEVHTQPSDMLPTTILLIARTHSESNISSNLFFRAMPPALLAHLNMQLEKSVISSFPNGWVGDEAKKMARVSTKL